MDEYIIMASCWNCNTLNTVLFFNKLNICGGMAVPVYALLNILIMIPFYMLYLFYGRYTKKGFITFWEIIPLFKGMAWTVTLYLIMTELFNISLGSLALLNIKYLVQEEDGHCNFTNNVTTCLSANFENGSTYECNENTTEPFSFVNFFLTDIKLNYFHAHLGDLKKTDVSWVVSLMFSYCLVYVLLLRGPKEFIKIITPIVKITYGVSIIPTLVIMLVYRDKEVLPSTLDRNTFFVFKARFWICMLELCFGETIPGNLILLGSYLPREARSTEIAVHVVILKLLFMLTNLMWHSGALWVIKKTYRLSHFGCLNLSGLEVLFGIFPEAVSIVFPFEKFVVFTWFCLLWWYSMISMLCTFNAIVASVIDKKPKWSKNKKNLIGMFCLTCFVLNVGLLNPSFGVLLNMFERTIENKISYIIMVILCITISIYSVKVIADDFYFTYRKNLNKYWTGSLNSLALIVIITFLYQIEDLPNLYAFEQSVDVKVLFYIVMVVFFGPVIFLNVKIYFHYMKCGKVTMVFKPSTSWGPPTSINKMLRMNFIRTEEFFYNSQVQCKHNCLLNSENLKFKKKFFSRNKYRLLNYLEYKDKNV